MPYYRKLILRACLALANRLRERYKRIVCYLQNPVQNDLHLGFPYTVQAKEETWPITIWLKGILHAVQRDRIAFGISSFNQMILCSISSSSFYDLWFYDLSSTTRTDRIQIHSVSQGPKHFSISSTSVLTKLLCLHIIDIFN